MMSMEEWKEYRLGELCDTISDTYKGGAQEVVLINTSDVLDGKCLNHQKVANENLKGQFKKTFQYNDILYSEIRPANKRFAFVDFEATDYIASTKLMVLRHNEKITPQYLYYILKSQNVIDELQMLAESRSGTFPQITFSELSNLKVPLPNIKTQNKIISILSSLDDKIEVNRRINEQLEELAQALFKSWFVDFEPFKDGDFVESELGMIPKGWTTISLSKMADYLNGLAMQKFRPLQGEKGLPVLKIKELGQDSCNETSELCSPSLVNEKYIVNDGDVIFSWSGTLLVKIWCGGVCGLNQHLFKVTSEKYPKWFIYLWTKYHLDRFIRIAKDKAVTMGHIKRGELDTSFAIVPNEEKMKEIDGLMAPLIEQIIANNIEIRHLTALRDTLLPKLMSGEIDVNEVEI